MERLDLSRGYTRAFRFDGVGYLIVDTWMASYKAQDAAVTSLGSVCYYWFPQHSIDAMLEEGTLFFADQARFDAYVREHEQFLASLQCTYRERIRDTESLRRTDVEAFLELVCRIFTYFYRTEFFFVDRAFEHSRHDPRVAANLKRNYQLKEKARQQALNDVYLGKDGFLMVMLAKLARQFTIPTDDLLQYDVGELLAVFDGQRVDEVVLRERRRARVVFATDSVVHAYAGASAEADVCALMKLSGESVVPQGDELKGVPANKGRVVGRVKVIVSDPGTFDGLAAEFGKMQQGDILVAETTSPELMPACRKAGAILADQGGMLSHAAVVSREFGIPCIVGLRFAAQVLKDNDLVEVDAEKGIVTIVERSAKK